MKRKIVGIMVLGSVLGLSLPALAQETIPAAGAQADQNRPVKIEAGTRHKIKGVIVTRRADSFIMRDQAGGETQVNLNNDTKVEEKKENPFRRAKNYGTTQLLRGLTVEVEGRGDGSGALVADKVRMTDEALVTARTVESRVNPVEGRLNEDESRLSQDEANSQRLSGQIAELSAISNAATDSARSAQETAGTAVSGVNATNNRIDALITGLDEYESKRDLTVNFRAGKATLSPKAKATLDEIAAQAKREGAYLIEITGFASADGGENLNLRLSRERADAVVQYLTANQLIPLRRIVTPFGYGDAQPIADNKTHEGRKENRRVEVKILVNKGLASPPPAVRINQPDNTANNQ